MKFIKKNLFHKCDIIHVHATQISFIPEVWASPPPPIGHTKKIYGILVQNLLSNLSYKPTHKLYIKPLNFTILISLFGQSKLKLRYYFQDKKLLKIAEYYCYSKTTLRSIFPYAKVAFSLVAKYTQPKYASFYICHCFNCTPAPKYP